jgi:glycosyltransferase involved in cell wall biosynthesis
MRILMLAPTPFFADRGCHVRVLGSYYRLRREHAPASIKLLTYPRGRDIPGLDISRVAALPGYDRTAPGFSPYRPALDGLMLARATAEVRRRRYDLIYGHLHEGALIGILLKPLARVPVVFDCQGSLVGELTAQQTITAGGLAARSLARIERFIYRHSDRIVTSSEALRDFVREQVPHHPALEVISDEPDPELFDPDVERAPLGLPAGKKFVVYLGGLQRYKGIDSLLAAIPAAHPDAHFLIMGYPVDEVRREIERLGLADRVTLTGRIPYEQAPAYLRWGDLAVSPKVLGSGEANAKLYNYLAMGLPVVCFDDPANRQILGERGYYARQGDPADFARQINRALGLDDPPSVAER